MKEREMAGGDAQRRMIDEIVAEVRDTRRWLGKSELDPKVIDAMARVPRHEFVPPGEGHVAYANAPLPIGHGQTISQPYIVAVTTDTLGVGEGDRVLDVGTGSGYQAAILAELVDRVYGIEIVEELATQARDRLFRLGYTNVEVRAGDGHRGWPEHAPYDGIVVAAATPTIPPALIEQLRPGGRLIIPIGGRFMSQDLVLVEKGDDGKVRKRSILPVSFVPLTGGP